MPRTGGAVTVVVGGAALAMAFWLFQEGREREDRLTVFVVEC